MVNRTGCSQAEVSTELNITAYHQQFADKETQSLEDLPKGLEVDIYQN